MSVVTPVTPDARWDVGRRRSAVRGIGSRRRAGLHLFLAAVSIVWLFPLGWAVYASLRPYADTASRGYVSLPGTLGLDNYAQVWATADLPRFFLNTMVVAVPTVVLVLLLGSMIGFATSRFDQRFLIGMLVVFTAGNLLPPQVLIVPLYELYLALPLPAPLSDNGVVYDQYVGIIAIHVAFQLGFCGFVMAAYMRTLPGELIDAALVDGASVLRIFWQVVLPLCRPPLAALATLTFTWVYNDYFWGLVLMRTGDRRPITSALTDLSGAYFTDHNLVAAGAVLVALPTLLVFLLAQRHLIGGLTLGGTRD